MHPHINRDWSRCMLYEKMRRSELEKLVADKLQKVLKHAATTVPYYQRYFAQHPVGRAEFRLADFPIIEKGDIRNHESDFISSQPQGTIAWARTSGSTGEPFRFGRSEFTYTYATVWRGLARFGIRPGDKRVIVTGVDEVPQTSRVTKIRRAIYGWINRCIVIDAHFLARSEENILSELKRIVSYKPQYFHGYVSSIYLLARTAEEHGIDLASLHVKAVVTESEKCYPFQRELMERVFGAPIVEYYGCVEFGMIAQPATDGAPCINEDHVVAETDDDGNAVFTNLDEFSFPLIRFRNGDKLKLGGLHKVLPYRTIEGVEGRIAETIHLPQGGSLQGYIVMYPISKHMNVLKAYQVYQPDIDHLKIRLIPTVAEISTIVQEQILREMREITGPRIDIAIEIIEDIPLTKRGKRAFVVSDVKDGRRK